MNRKAGEAVIYFVALGIYLALCFWLPVEWPDLQDRLLAKQELLIPAGASATEAAALIEKAGLILDRRQLIREMAKSGIDRKLLPGIYLLHKSTPAGLVHQLSAQKPQMNKITIVPGERYRTLTARLGKDKQGKDYLLAALSDKNNFYPETRALLPEKPSDRMLYLFPETYFLSPGSKAASELVARASELWYREIGLPYAGKLTKASFFNHGILASLVEGEARFPDEQAILAGIFMNRLQKKMKLQSCATVVYAWEQKNIKKKKLSYLDLKIESPYNTYLFDGLPPGPVCVPGRGAWLSAITPKPTEYLFFFADKDGRHIFSKNYREHIDKQKRTAR